MKSQSDETIDVVIPAYNCKKYIIQAIQSIERQTHKPKKIIIVNDGSTDRTKEIIQTHRSSIPIEYIEKANGGPNSARNIGLKRATAEYVAFLDADDEWEPIKIQKQISIFQKTTYQNLGVVYCKYRVINEYGEIIPHSIVLPDPTMRGNVFKKLLPANLITGSASAVLIRRSLFEKTGDFDENLRVGEDWDMWLRLAKECEFDYVDQDLVNIRRHQANTQNNSIYAFDHLLRFYNKWVQLLPINEIPTVWGVFFIGEILTHISRISYLVLFQRNLSPASKKKIYHIIVHKLLLYLISRILFLPIQLSIGILKRILTNIYAFFQSPKSTSQFSSKKFLRARERGESFIFTEIYGCGKIGKIALKSAYLHHPDTPINIFGTPNDFQYIEKHPQFVFHDISNEAKILNNFNYGHLGTASLWAKIILEREEQYIIHFDSDVIFRAPVFDDLIEKLRSGYSIVGSIRNYQHNPGHIDNVCYLSDVSQTMCFGFNREKITARDYTIFTKMCQGTYNPYGHPVIDFFDPVMFDILRNNGTIYYLSQDEFGGCDLYGKRVNKYPKLNAVIDFGDKLVHFSSVGSGMYYYLHPDRIGNKVPRAYIDYAKEKYAVFCKIFYNEDIDIPYDKDKYRSLFEIKDWYHGK